MSSVIISGDTSGSVTLSVPAVSGTNTATLPAATGTVMVSGNQPAFSAYANAIQNISNATWTKIQINTKEFDTALAYDATTNYRYQPLVAGYYQVNVANYFSGSAVTGFGFLGIYKNGTIYKQSLFLYSALSGNLGGGSMPTEVYLNGSTDYIEFWMYQNTGTSQPTASGQSASWFNACLVRAA